MSFPPLAEIEDAFSQAENWDERYDYLLELGDLVPDLPEEFHREEFRVQGCTSNVWLVAKSLPDGRIEFQADSDSDIVRGLIGILFSVYHGRTASEILGVDIESIFVRLGLRRHLSQARSNGFASMVRDIRIWAERLANERQKA